MKVIEVRNKSGMLLALDMAQYEDKGTVMIKCGSFEVTLRDPMEAGNWVGCVLMARRKALARLRKKVKRAPQSLFQVAV